jgi:uncharacterized protein GlcG (DUF336 family)
MATFQDRFHKIIKQAKREAERDGSAVAILNLNQIGSPMLVIRPREWSDSHDCVAQVHADGTVTETGRMRN